MMLALLLGTALSLAALAYVLAPLVVGVKPRPGDPVAVRGGQPEDFAVSALRESELDHAMGKLSQSDYAILRERYASEALTAMRAADAIPSAIDDAAEAAVRAYRSAHLSCRTCGIRPETDAIYCSTCGRYLPGKCASCGTTVTAAGVRYCIDCGTRLAAV
jgi:hypothetical protein